MVTAPERYAGAGELFKVLAAPVRLGIVVELVSGRRCVHELVTALDTPQPLVSQHLRVLRSARLVRAKRRGREIEYELTDDHVAHIALDALRHVEEAPRGGAMTVTDHRSAERHTHTHGPGCGHEAVVHHDHVDYVHDGHAHHEHEGHYDECGSCRCAGCSDLCARCDCSDCSCATCNHASCSCANCGGDTCANCACADCTCATCKHAA